MTTSPRVNRISAVKTSHPACPTAPRFSSSLVGWLIQTAVIAVVEGTCETYYESRGSESGLRPESSAKFAFPLNVQQSALISKIWSRESKLFTTGYVAGERPRRRAVTG
jgi:hypothetical protein